LPQPPVQDPRDNLLQETDCRETDLKYTQPQGLAGLDRPSGT